MVIKILILIAVVLVSVLLYRKMRKKPKEKDESEEEMPVGMQIKDEDGNILYDFFNVLYCTACYMAACQI